MAVLIAPTAVEWLTDASPKLQTAIASSGHGRATSEFGGPLDGERDPDRARKVGGDRRRLGDDVQIVPAEDFVPPAGDRLLGRRDDPEQHVAQPVASSTCRARARKKPPER